MPVVVEGINSENEKRARTIRGQLWPQNYLFL
jgi:hypothetical protein